MKIKALMMIFLLLGNLGVHALPIAKLTIRVIDESGNPIANAKAGMSITSPRPSALGSDSTNIDGFTDIEGLYTSKK